MSQTTMNNRDRWLVACHESGHCVAALVLNGRCAGALIDFDGGSAHVRDLFANNEAFMLAAGSAGELLADQYEAPCVEIVPFAVVSANPPASEDRAFVRACLFSDMPGCSRKFESDDRRLALWAISENESEPDRWVRRIAFAHHVAAEIVSKNKESIIRIARELFQRGVLTGREITELYEGQKNG